MKLRLKAVAGLLLMLGLLAGCAGQTSGSTPGELGQVSDGHSVTVERIVGRGSVEPDHISIVCVDGSAFLYVWTAAGRGGGPTIARFLEKDETCPTG